MITSQWNPQLCEETLLLFERLRKKKEDEFDALICEASCGGARKVTALERKLMKLSPRTRYRILFNSYKRRNRR